MFERERAYPCAVTCNGAKEPQRAQAAAIRWVVKQHQVVGGQILLYVPTKGDLDNMDNLVSEPVGKGFRRVLDLVGVGPSVV